MTARFKMTTYSSLCPQGLTLFKLKRSRKPRIKARQWVPVQISIADKSVLLFSEDGRLVEEVDIHADQNVGAIQVERNQDICNSMPIYVVKLLR